MQIGDHVTFPGGEGTLTSVIGNIAVINTGRGIVQQQIGKIKSVPVKTVTLSDHVDVEEELTVIQNPNESTEEVVARHQIPIEEDDGDPQEREAENDREKKTLQPQDGRRLQLFREIYEEQEETVSDVPDIIQQFNQQISGTQTETEEPKQEDKQDPPSVPVRTPNTTLPQEFKTGSVDLPGRITKKWLSERTDEELNAALSIEGLTKARRKSLEDELARRASGSAEG